MESRGIDISRFGPLPVCSTMIVSVRPPERWPALTTLRCSAVRSLARSLPTTRYVVPGCSSGRLPAGSASTFSTVVHAQIGIAIRKTSHSEQQDPQPPQPGPREAGPPGRPRSWSGEAERCRAGPGGWRAAPWERPRASLGSRRRPTASLLGHHPGGVVRGPGAALVAVEPVVLGGALTGTSVSPGTISHGDDRTVPPGGERRTPSAHRVRPSALRRVAPGVTRVTGDTCLDCFLPRAERHHHVLWAARRFPRVAHRHRPRSPDRRRPRRTRALPPRRRADGDDPGPARLRAAGRRQPSGGPRRHADLDRPRDRDAGGVRARAGVERLRLLAGLRPPRPRPAAGGC